MLQKNKLRLRKNLLIPLAGIFVLHKYNFCLFFVMNIISKGIIQNCQTLQNI